jgi:hypothetical protein
MARKSQPGAVVETPPPEAPALSVAGLPAFLTPMEAIAWIMFRTPKAVDQTTKTKRGSIGLTVEWAMAPEPRYGPNAAEAEAELLAKLQAGDLQAKGRLEGEAGRRDIPTSEWRDLQIVEGEQGAFRAEAPGRAWHDLLLSRDAVVRAWGRPGAEIMRTGTEGRPSSMPHIRAEHARRMEEGRASRTLAEEARLLREWFERSYPDASIPTLKTIENRIREAHRQHFLAGKPPEII